MAAVERLSHSSLEDLKQCGHKYFLRKIEKVKQAPGWSLIGGNAVHHVTEAIDRQDFGIPVEAEALDFETELEKLTALEEEKSGYSRDEFYRAGRVSKANPNKEDMAWWLREGPLMVNRWVNFKRVANWEIWITPNGEPAIELGLRTEYASIPVQGYADLIMQAPGGDLVVVDKKTGANMPKGPSQLVQYGDQASKLFGVEVKYGAFWDARSGGMTAPVGLGPLTHRLEEEYRVAKAMVEQDLFLANPGMMCTSCSVNHACVFRPA